MDSVVLLEQIRTIDKQRLIKYIGKLSDTVMKQIDEAYLISIGVIPRKNDYERQENENEKDN